MRVEVEGDWAAAEFGNLLTELSELYDLQLLLIQRHYVSTLISDPHYPN